MSARTRFSLVLGLIAALVLAAPALAQYESPCQEGTICVGDVSVSEGNAGTTQAVFTITAPNANVTVTYQTMADGNASEGVDFQPASGTVSIPANGSTTVVVLVVGDTVVEPNELFNLHLASSTGAAISKHHGAGTIMNDDGPVTTPDTTPPNTFIHGGPGRVTRSRRASFHLASTEPASRFQCKLDARPWRACRANLTLRRLSRGLHTLRVRAIDAAGNVDRTPARKTWRVR